MEKTIDLYGDEIAVSVKNKHVDIRNDGTSTIYASRESGGVPGGDGVMSIPGGSSAKLLDVSGTVYLSGTGSVLIVDNNFATPVFKSAAAGGGGGGSSTDQTARNMITMHAGNQQIHLNQTEIDTWDGAAVSIDDHIKDTSMHLDSHERSYWNSKADTTAIPTHTSELQNDSGFITSANIPTKTSDLTNDDGFITSADIPTEISAFNNDVGYLTSASLPTVPTKVSELQNDSGFITSPDGGNAASVGGATVNQLINTVLSARTAIPANDNLDTYRAGGSYIINKADTSSVINSPANKGIWGEGDTAIDVYRKGIYAYQIATYYTGEQLRRYSTNASSTSATWTDWMPMSDHTIMVTDTAPAIGSDAPTGSIVFVVEV